MASAERPRGFDGVDIMNTGHGKSATPSYTSRYPHVKTRTAPNFETHAGTDEERDAE